VDPLNVSLIIPTYNERDNIRPLLEKIEHALTGEVWEALFVDDSNDGTDDVLADIARVDPRVRVLHRADNRGGLAGAIVDGLEDARGTYVCVLDADLQHPPARIPAMLAEAQRTSADLIIASRYMPGGSAGGLDGPVRRSISFGLKLASQISFPMRLAGITDPLGGFFVFRRAIVQGVHLRPTGYKILLEILIRCPWDGVGEVPYSFQPRLHCDSKADFRQGLRFLHHLATLFVECSPLLAIPRMIFGSRSLDDAVAPRPLPLKQ
jgi:dolichol-phosphate mannosyltransferase